VFCVPVFGVPAFGQSPNAQGPRGETPEIVAEVNGERITRTSLAAETLQLHGEAELHDLIYHTLIRLESERLNITVTSEEINAEIFRMAQAASLTTEQLLQTIERQRSISPARYQQDIARRLALGKIAEQLAGSRLNVSPEELRAAYDAQFGPAVRARQIVFASRADAEAAHAELQQHPEIFAAIARNRSICEVTQPFGGALREIRRHTMHPYIENMLFSMQPGQISPIIENFPFPGQFAIFTVMEFLQPVEIDTEAVKRQLFFQIRDAKLPQVANEVFAELQNRAQVQVVFGNPVLHAQYPGVAAILNGQPISIRELAEICIQRHGESVLNDKIHRLLIEQAARREGIVISERDINNEIREMAYIHLPLLPNGEPNVELWLRRALEATGLSLPMYRKNVVVPVVLLKQLTHPHVQITEEDIQRSFEANFGKRIRCLAIFFRAQDTRRAQEVWQMANRHRTEENFGDLAERWSFDPYSRMGRGVIPPIARHTGQPILEREAFSLQPGELSQIIQIGDHLVILFCVAHIPPVSVRIEDVRDDLVADLFAKKQQMIINRYFEQLLEQAVLTNHLTGERQNPHLERAVREEPTLQR